MLYILEALTGIILNARTSAWVNQKGYTTIPYNNHKWKTKYVIYPKSAQALCWRPGLQPEWTRKDTQHFPLLTMSEKAKYVTYPRSAQALYWMPGLQPGWTRKDTQHLPLLTINIKPSMLHIPEALRRYTECQDFSLSEPKRIHNISLYWSWMKS